MATSETDICNRALQKLGAKAIVSLTQDSVNARACNAAYADVRDALMSAHRWNFAIKRVSLAADSPVPEWGRANAFTLPSDCLQTLDDYPESNFNSKDWVIEGRKILTNDSAPIYLRYIARITDTQQFHALFSEALSSLLAFEMAEALTQSNTKKAALAEEADRKIKEAKKQNAIQNVPQLIVEDTFITVRA